MKKLAKSLFMIALIGCAPTPPFEEVETGIYIPVKIVEDPDYKKLTFIGKYQDCEIRLTHYLNGSANQGVARIRSYCGYPLKVRYQVLGEILNKVLTRSEGRLPFHTIYQGRMIHDGFMDHQVMSSRLAAAVSESAHWNLKSGVSKGKRVNDLIKEIANKYVIYREYQKFFKHYDLKLSISGVEKVLVSEVGSLPFKFEKEFGIKEIRYNDIVPYDAMVWFKLEPYDYD